MKTRVIPIPKLQNKDLHQWRQVGLRTINNCSNLADDLKYAYHNTMTLAGVYRSLAVIDYFLNEDIAVVHKHFELASQLALNELEFAVNGHPEAVGSVSSVDIALAITLALLAEQPPSVQAITQAAYILRERKIIQVRNVYEDLYQWSIIDLAARKDASVVTLAETILANRRKEGRKFYEPFAKATLSLVQGNVQKVTLHAVEFLDTYAARARRMWHEDGEFSLVCFPGMAFVKLAIQRGYNIKIDHPFLMQEMLV